MPLNRGKPAVEDLLRALADRDRRGLLSALKERSPQDEVPVPEVVHGGERELEVLRQRFYHNHLPHLDTLGLISWNRVDNEVGKGPYFDDVRAVLELLEEFEDELSGGVV